MSVSRAVRVGLAVLAAGMVIPGCNQASKIRQQALTESTAVTFPSSDGVRLDGRLFGPEGATAGVVLAHMLPSDQSSWFDFADRLSGVGYRALTFDFRGYCPGGDAGCSGGEKDISGIWQDIEGAVAFLRSKGARTVSLIGASMGGTASLIVASKEGDAIASVITLSAPESIEGLVAGPDVLQTVTAAKLFLAGDGDQTAATSAAAFYNEGLQPKRYELLTTDDHGTAILEGNQAEIARTLILGWLSQHAPVSGS